MWPFRRRRAVLIPLLPDETWRAGDMAECVDDAWVGRAVERWPARGARALVLAVTKGEAEAGPFSIVGLQLLGFPEMWDARGFRKVVLTDTGADRTVADREPIRRQKREEWREAEAILETYMTALGMR